MKPAKRPRAPKHIKLAFNDHRVVCNYCAYCTSKNQGCCTQTAEIYPVFHSDPSDEIKRGFNRSGNIIRIKRDGCGYLSSTGCTLETRYRALTCNLYPFILYNMSVVASLECPAVLRSTVLHLQKTAREVAQYLLTRPPEQLLTTRIILGLNWMFV